MKLDKRMINTLLVILGLAIILVAYFVFYTDNNTKTEQVVNETKPLTTRLNELKAHDAKRAEYEQGIKDAARLASDTLAQFPAKVFVEDSIMYATGMEDDLFSTASAAAPVAADNAEPDAEAPEASAAPVDATKSSSAEVYFAPKFLDSEAGRMFHVHDMVFEVPVLLSQFEAKTEPDQETAANYSVYGLTTTVGATDIGYTNLKRAIRWINSYTYRTKIDEINVNYDANTGLLAGTVTYTKVYVDDGNYEYAAPKIPQGNHGIENPFGLTQ
ncbi:MAG: hypothetical protein LBN43_08785 [Oscillospiraceae bacterium]|jgi:hypothetical protein|nr:hypothetical protein [Oscillospiraceae bacterium]